MKTKTNRYPRFFVSQRYLLLVMVVFIALVALASLPLLSTAASSLPSGKALPGSRDGSLATPVRTQYAVTNSVGLFDGYLTTVRNAGFLNFSAPLQETMETFAADCTTPKSSFVLGETVCAKTDGVDLNFPGGRWVHWLREDLSIAQGGSGTTDITVNPQTFSFAPDAVGSWKVTIAELGDDSQTPAVFTVNQAPPVATYAGDCVTPKTIFNLGDIVCAKATGVDFALGRRFAWIDPAGFIEVATTVTTDPQTDSFNLPTTDTSLIGGLFTVENRGFWKVNVITSRGSVVASAPFSVQGATPAADLSVSEGLAGAPGNAGDPITYIVSLSNLGPNGAASVQLTNATPVNATFQSITQVSGPTFSCTGNDPVICTAANLPSGGSAVFEITYIAGAAGSTLATTASATSTTEELNAEDNATSAPSVRVSGGGAGSSCSLGCPENIFANANTTQGQTRGANVDFSVEPNGGCGAVTSSPASGSFFPVGTTPVSASSAEGGGACTFTVTVTEAAAPTISCPANHTVAAASGATEAEVSIGTPQASGNQVTVVGVRSDNLDLNAPYPVGTTTVTWTATDVDSQSATCTQTITVTSSDSAPPTIECPADPAPVQAAAGQCQATVAVGFPTTTGTGVTTVGERSDGLAVSAPYPAGTTLITWTATDSAGRSVSCLQTVTVTADDATAPTVTAPPNITVFTNAGSCSTILDNELGNANATDNCSGVQISTAGIPAGNDFPVGVTTLTYTATDAAGNTSAPATQLVTVKESPTQPPVITAPANASYQCASQVPGANPADATASDSCGTPTVTVNEVTNGGAGSPASPLIITRTYKATDASGNTASATQTITVSDTTAPVISCPTNITQSTDPGTCSANVNPGTATATDNCGAVTIAGSRSDSQPLNAPYPSGTTTITWTATDASGNQSSCLQTVTVNPPTTTALGPANFWVGLKNSDSVGVRFDFLVEVFKNQTLIGSGQLDNQAGGSSGFNNAILRTVAIAQSQAASFCPGDTLSIRLSVRAGPTGHVSGWSRLWYDDSAANSRFDATINGATNSNYLLNGLVLGNAPGPGPKKTIDVFVHRNQGGNPFKPFGTWTRTF